MSGVSISFISDLTNGKSNPSFRIMERIADALDEPLPALLGKTDLDSQSLKALAVGKPRGIAEGYERVSLILPSHQAYVAKQWARKSLETEKKHKTETG
jgi:transcriptional regulator with XRE-family HTH domain